MFQEPLPTDLTQVEQDIGLLLRFQPQVEFGRRIIGAMRGEMRRERTAANWRFAVGLAAAAFLWLHLSFYAAPVTDFHIRRSPPAISMDYGVSGPLFQCFPLTDSPW
jgi:hypothetical protein